MLKSRALQESDFCPNEPTVQSRSGHKRLRAATYPLSKGTRGSRPQKCKEVYSDVGGWKKEFGLYDNQEDAEAAIDAFWAAVCALEGGGAVGPVTPEVSGTKRKAPPSLKWRKNKAFKGGGHGHRNEEQYEKEKAQRAAQRAAARVARRDWFRTHGDELYRVRRNSSRLISSVLTLASDGGPVEESVQLGQISDKQRERLQDQCTALIHYFYLCAEKYGCDDQVYGPMEDGQQVGDEQEEQVYMHDLAEIAGKTVWVSGITVQRWYASYLEHDCRFSLDGRGHWERQWILNEEDLLLKFEHKAKALVKAEEPKFVDAMYDYVNNELLSNEEVYLGKHGLTLPVSRSTVHAWIHKLDDTGHEEAGKHFYTDNHEKATTVKYRQEYVERQEALEMRKPAWMQMPLGVYQDMRGKLPQLAEGHRYKTAEGEDWVELHVDACGAFDKLRLACVLGGNFSVRWARSTTPPAADHKCKYYHAPGKCKCHLPLYHAGQDESVFKAYQRGKKSWKIKGFRAQRKKSDGPGEMVSAFQDEIRGFGFPMTADELDLVNAFRATQAPPREPLTESPGIRYLKYGSGEKKEGWWDWDKFKVQVTDFLDCFDVLYPEMQLQMEIDWSSGHAKFPDGALNANPMAVGFGGKQPKLRATLLTEGCVNADTHQYLVDENTVQVPDAAIFTENTFTENTLTHLHTGNGMDR